MRRPSVVRETVPGAAAQPAQPAARQATGQAPDETAAVATASAEESGMYATGAFDSLRAENLPAVGAELGNEKTSAEPPPVLGGQIAKQGGLWLLCGDRSLWVAVRRNVAGQLCCDDLPSHLLCERWTDELGHVLTLARTRSGCRIEWRW